MIEGHHRQLGGTITLSLTPDSHRQRPTAIAYHMNPMRKRIVEESLSVIRILSVLLQWSQSGSHVLVLTMLGKTTRTPSCVPLVFALSLEVPQGTQVKIQSSCLQHCNE